ncbi:hypothetical protein N665_2060s0001 [Sinapis alba]|nr:hypothetical protein N665_2060s0001 [Sinapis alba]
MSLQSNLLRQRGSSSSARRRLDLDVEEEIIRIPACDLTAASERFKKTLIGRVIHRGGRSVEAMINLLPRARIWNVEGRARGTNLGNGRFQFDFDKEEDLLMVLNKRPCHFNHWIFALERWEPSTSENFPNTIPFWIKITGVPVHFWNDDTFSEIAKALGKLEAIDANNARLQVSIDADKPLKLEAKVGFPNGDVGKVYLTYEGLNRYCFSCKRISHDLYSCPELSPEEREHKMTEYRELNSETQTYKAINGPPGSNRNKITNKKRPRSPMADAYQRSPSHSAYPGNSRGEKRSKESENYWTSRTLLNKGPPSKASDKKREEQNDRYQQKNQKDTVWNRLESQARRKPVERTHHSKEFSLDRQRGRVSHRGNDRNLSHHSQLSQQVWRPRSQVNDEKSISQSKTATNSKNLEASPQEKSDSQQTLSGVLVGGGGLGIQRNGVLVVHNQETSEERMRRLKGKSHMIPESKEKTPLSVLQNAPKALLTRDRGTLTIREGETQTPIPHPRFVLSPLRLRNGTEDPSLELDNLMVSDHLDNMVLTREEEAEVNKLVDEFGDVVMDDTMLQNDDLLVDEPGFDAEIIDAISQLSPANAEKPKKLKEVSNRKEKQDSSAPASASQTIITYQMKSKSTTMTGNSQALQLSGSSGGIGAKKKLPRSPDLKGVRASKKLNALKARPSPRKQRGSGNFKKPLSHTVPRIEVFPSAKSTICSSVSGSVGSQKPPSKKI